MRAMAQVNNNRELYKTVGRMEGTQEMMIRYLNEIVGRLQNIDQRIAKMEEKIGENRGKIWGVSAVISGFIAMLISFLLRKL